MTQTTRRKLVKFIIAVCTIAFGVHMVTQPTSLVNAADALNDVCSVFGNCPDSLKNKQSLGVNDARAQFVQWINIIANALVGIAAAVSIFFIIYAGWIILSGGGGKGSGGIEEGKKILMNAFIGLAVCILSFLIVRYMVGFLSWVYTK